MFSSVGRIGSTIRLALARRPWVRWAAIGVTSLTAGWLVLVQLHDVEAARRSWTDQRTVWVTQHDHAAGQPLVVEARRLPQAAIPVSASVASPAGIVARQRIGAGEVVTDLDLATGDGPALLADDGDVVVAVSDPLLQDVMTTVTIGSEVAVHSEGIVLAHRARIVAVALDVVFVAVRPSEAPTVSAAAQTRLASLAFLR